MISVKKQGPFEVFSRGVEEPWSIWRDGKPFKQVWTWPEVAAIVGEGPPTTKHATKKVRESKQAVRFTRIASGAYRSEDGRFEINHIVWPDEGRGYGRTDHWVVSEKDEGHRGGRFAWDPFETLADAKAAVAVSVQGSVP